MIIPVSEEDEVSIKQAAEMVIDAMQFKGEVKVSFPHLTHLVSSDSVLSYLVQTYSRKSHRSEMFLYLVISMTLANLMDNLKKPPAMQS